MAKRTFAIGDIHGDTAQLLKLFSRFPAFTSEDTVVFLGDYVDRGPDSAKAVESVRRLPSEIPAKVVALRGNHEDAWLRVVEHGWGLATGRAGCPLTCCELLPKGEERADPCASQSRGALRKAKEAV